MKTLTQWLIDYRTVLKADYTWTGIRLDKANSAVQIVESEGEDAAPEWVKKEYWDWRSAQLRGEA